MDIPYIIKFTPVFFKAIGLTLTLAFIGIFLALIVGLFCALITYYHLPFLKKPVKIYVEIARNTPLMIQLFFLFYGLPRLGILLDGTSCAVIGLAFLGGGYMAEAFRGGLNAIGLGQIESGLSLGLSRKALFRHIIFPQALTISLPAISANVIFLIKETSVVSIVAVADIMYVAYDLLMEGHSTETNLMMVMAYLIAILPISLIANRIEKRLRYAGFGS
jgi:polar amino acid transport system permease protein